MPGGPGLLVAGRPDVRGLPRAAPPAGQGLLRPGAAGLDGHGGLRPARGRVAAALGRGLRGLLRGREALVAARPGHALASQSRLARARRVAGRRPRQLGAALPHHLGHRPRRGGALRAPGARGRGPRAGGAALPPPRGRAGHHGRRGHRRARQGAGGQLGGARPGARPHRDRRLRGRAPRPWCSPPAASAATTTWCARSGPTGWAAARADALRRPRPRGRPDAGDRQGRGRQRDQRGPHVALRRGDPQLGPDLAHARHPDHPRALVACGSTRAGPRLPGPLYPGFDTLATLAHIQQTGHDYTWFVLTRKIIEKEFALSGSEQNPDTTSKSWRAVLKDRMGSGPPGPVAGVHGQRRRTSSWSATCATWWPG